MSLLKSLFLAFAILTFDCTNASLEENVGNIRTSLEEEVPEIELVESFIGVDSENVFHVTVPSDSDNNALKESWESNTNCTGELFDFVQCVVRSKIESFRLEWGKLQIPTTPPRDHQLQAIENKIEGSLEDWLEKLRKQRKEIDSLKGSWESNTNCTGELFDFVQCVVRSKIESFRLEWGKLQIPTTPPRDHQLKAFENKIEGSLEDWLEKL